MTPRNAAWAALLALIVLPFYVAFWSLNQFASVSPPEPRNVLPAKVMMPGPWQLEEPLAAEGEPPAQEAAFTFSPPEKVVQAAIVAARRHDLELWLLLCVTGRESRLQTGATGALGELGPAQLLPTGKLPDFYAAGFEDPRDPEEAMEFLAGQLAAGAGPAWSTYRGCA